MTSPSIDLVRSVTDEHVLRALMRTRRLTRAELAAEIGISKPTAGESVRRLTERGLVVDTGERTPGGRGRGRVGSYYSLSASVGTALAVNIAPSGVVAELVDAYGEVVARASRPGHPSSVGAALREVADEVGGSPRLAVVSAADPVDRATGRLVHLPDSPFLVGALDPVAILGPYVDGPIVVDNDVNWAARAEQPFAGDEFAYLFLGEGLGCAIVSDGSIRRGGSGLAGEIAHVFTPGPGSGAVPFIEVFALLDLRLAPSVAPAPVPVPAPSAAPTAAPSTAIDVPLLLARKSEISEVLSSAIAGVVAAVVALADPARVVIGGSWGPSFLDEIRVAVDALPRQVPVVAASITGEPSLLGARRDAVDRLRSAIAS
jgi:predicted NBD/HSP70 family sugar kinase